MSNPYNMHASSRERAKSHLAHYFGLALGGLSGDNAMEIGEIVDSIIDATVEEIGSLENENRELKGEVADLVKEIQGLREQLNEPETKELRDGEGR